MPRPKFLLRFLMNCWAFLLCQTYICTHKNKSRQSQPKQSHHTQRWLIDAWHYIRVPKTIFLLPKDMHLFPGTSVKFPARLFSRTTLTQWWFCSVGQGFLWAYYHDKQVCDWHWQQSQWLSESAEWAASCVPNHSSCLALTLFIEYYNFCRLIKILYNQVQVVSSVLRYSHHCWQLPQKRSILLSKHWDQNCAIPLPTHLRVLCTAHWRYAAYSLGTCGMGSRQRQFVLDHLPKYLARTQKSSFQW